MNNYVNSNGNITSVVKNKDINRPIRGEAEIEIYDIKTGEVVTRAKTENLLSNKAIWDMFFKQLIPISGVSADTWTGSCFNNLVLSNYDGIEDSSLECVQGDVIGWADLTQPVETTISTQGSLVPSQTQFIEKIFKFVAEFGQDKVNGTFNTIWLTSACNNPNSLENGMNGLFMDFKKIENIDGNMQDVMCYRDINRKLYGFTQDKAYIYKIESTMGKKNVVLEQITDILPHDYNYITSVAYIKDLDIFITTDTKNLTAFDNNLSQINKIPASFTGELASYKNFLLIHKQDTYNNRKLSIYSAQNLTQIAEIELPVDCDDINEIKTDWEQKYLYVVGNNRGTGKSICYVFRINSETSYTLLSKTAECFNKSELKGLTNINLYSSTMFLAEGKLLKSFIEFGTQTKLARPITKTAGQGMRIVYTFSINV